MRLLGFVLLLGMVALLSACGGQESRLSSTGEQPADKEAQMDQDTEDGAAIDQLKTTPDPEPEQQVDKPTVDPPAVDPPAFPDRILDRKKAQKLEVRHSMLGFRSTLLFYTFNDEKAILTLAIGNTDETFPVKGKIHLFDDATTEEGLKKWINNQHSDGLFPEVPTPTFTGELPEGTCRVTSHKQTGASENPSPISPATFKNYEVKLSVKEHAIDKKVKLSAFTDTALVHVKSE